MRSFIHARLCMGECLLFCLDCPIANGRASMDQYQDIDLRIHVGLCMNGYRNLFRSSMVDHAWIDCRLLFSSDHTGILIQFDQVAMGLRCHLNEISTKLQRGFVVITLKFQRNRNKASLYFHSHFNEIAMKLRCSFVENKLAFQ